MSKRQCRRNYEVRRTRQCAGGRRRVRRSITKGLVGKIQHMPCTSTPSPGASDRPLIAAIISFGLLLGSKFFSPFALTLILQQVQIVGIVAAAQAWSS